MDDTLNGYTSNPPTHLVQQPDTSNSVFRSGYLLYAKVIQHGHDLERASLFKALVLFLLLARVATWPIHVHPNSKLRVPVQGLPFTWPARLSFFRSAKSTIKQGFDKYKGRAWKLCVNDVIVLPPHYVNEVKNAPSEQLNSILALLENSEGDYAQTNVLGTSELHTTVIRKHLTPKLGLLVDALRDEFYYGMAKDFPECNIENWTPITVYPILHSVVGRMAARAFVGPRLCRNEKWLHHSEAYTNSAFPTIILMRLIPDSLKRISSWFLPTPWITKYHQWRAFQILLPEIEARNKLTAEQKLRDTQRIPNSKETFQDNFLQMMLDHADGNEAEPKSVAGRVLSLTLASNHTTAMALTETLYDLCVYPEYQDELRTEIQEALQSQGGWSKATLTAMRKMDSFMNESRRLNPPSQMGLKRKALIPYTFSDGYRIPTGAHVEFAIVPIQRSSVPDPDHFDGLRYYRRRLDLSQSHKWQFATTDSTTLHFGHGRYACPGRFMASNVIKIVLANLLLEYDFRLEDRWKTEGEGEEWNRPPSWPAFEYSFPNPVAKVLFKKRQA